jgi:hypothetical protein
LFFISFGWLLVQQAPNTVCGYQPWSDRLHQSIPPKVVCASPQHARLPAVYSHLQLASCRSRCWPFDLSIDDCCRIVLLSRSQFCCLAIWYAIISTFLSMHLRRLTPIIISVPSVAWLHASVQLPRRPCTSPFASSLKVQQASKLVIHLEFWKQTRAMRVYTRASKFLHALQQKHLANGRISVRNFYFPVSPLSIHTFKQSVAVFTSKFGFS